MSVSVNVSLHDLTAESLRYSHVYVSGEQSSQPGSAAVVLDGGPQLHWASLDALDAFVERLGELAVQARREQQLRGMPALDLDGVAQEAVGAL